MSKKLTTNTKERLSFLDTARGIAALLVVFAHGLEVSRVTEIYSNLLGWVHYDAFGVAGVVTFFFVSGFVIPLSLEKSRNQRYFWANRALRIYPLYFAVYFITLSLNDFGDLDSFLAFVKNFFAHLFFVQEYVKQQNFVGGSWTLSLEFIWYIGFSLLFQLGWNKKNWLLVFLAVAGSIMAILVSKYIIALPMGRLSMLITCLFGLIHYRRLSGDISGKQFYQFSLLLALVILINVSFRSVLKSHTGVVTLFWNISPWILAYSIFECAFHFRNRKLLSHPVLLFIGRISYSLYLVHPIVLIILKKLDVTGLWYMVLLFITAIPLSYITYRFIESFPIKVGHSYLKKHLLFR